VNVHITYTGRRGNLEEVLRESKKVFPRWYARDWKEAGTLGEPLTIGTRTGTSRRRHRARLSDAELTNHAEDERTAILDRAETLLQEME